MNLSDKYSTIERILKGHFKNELINISYNIQGRMRVLFSNAGVLDIRYPVDTSYSFFLYYNDCMYRIDTAPHHKEIKTFPNHCHYKTEDNVIADEWTCPSNNLEDNILGLITWLELIFNQ